MFIKKPLKQFEYSPPIIQILSRRTDNWGRTQYQIKWISQSLPSSNSIYSFNSEIAHQGNNQISNTSKNIKADKITWQPITNLKQYSQQIRQFQNKYQEKVDWSRVNKFSSIQNMGNRSNEAKVGLIKKMNNGGLYNQTTSTNKGNILQNYKNINNKFNREQFRGQSNNWHISNNSKNNKQITSNLNNNDRNNTFIKNLNTPLLESKEIKTIAKHENNNINNKNDIFHFQILSQSQSLEQIQPYKNSKQNSFNPFNSINDSKNNIDHNINKEINEQQQNNNKIISQEQQNINIIKILKKPITSIHPLITKTTVNKTLQQKIKNKTQQKITNIIRIYQEQKIWYALVVVWNGKQKSEKIMLRDQLRIVIQPQILLKFYEQMLEQKNKIINNIQNGIMAMF